jgi:hypothetical protein
MRTNITNVQIIIANVNIADNDMNNIHNVDFHSTQMPEQGTTEQMGCYIQA